jgi:hypothetical protein
LEDRDPRLDDEPQGGADVLSWRNPDGVGHRFDDDTYLEWSPSSWLAICGTELADSQPDTDDEVDCMACIAKGWT